QAVKRQVDESTQLPDHQPRVVDAIHQDEKHVQAHHAPAHHPHHSAAHHSAAGHTTTSRGEGVDFVDEDDAAAPCLGLLACGPNHQVDADRIDAHEEHCERAAVRDVDRDVERGCNRLGKHRLAGARRPDHEHATLALAAGLHIEPAVLDQLQDPPHLADRRLLATHVFDVHAE